MTEVIRNTAMTKKPSSVQPNCKVRSFDDVRNSSSSEFPTPTPDLRMKSSTDILKVVALLCVTGTILHVSLYMHVDQGVQDRKTQLQPYRVSKSPWYVQNVFTENDKMAMFHDVCMEPGKDGAEIVVYNSPQNGSVNISVKTAYIVKGGANWTIHLSSLPLPRRKNYTYSRAAFFVRTACPGNFHHFLSDMTNGLFGAMKATGMLGSDTPSQLYYARNFSTTVTSSQGGCGGIAKFQDILYALPINKEHVYYKQARPHSCFANAIFGYYNKGYTPAEKWNHFKQAFNISCPASKRIRVTVIDRTSRRILNVDELVKATKKAGFMVKKVIMSELSIQEQLRAAMCTDILVGVQGAGLRWLDFLPPENSGLLELTWRDWLSRFATRARGQGRKATVLEAKKVVLNLPLYFKMVHRSSPKITKKLLKDYYEKGMKDIHDNHWKFADGIFDPTEFVKKLKSLVHVLHLGRKYHNRNIFF